MIVAAALGAAACRRHETPVDVDRDGVDARSDCDNSNPAVHATVTVYPDADGDGFGAEAARAFCTDGSVPAGYAVQGTDCAPEDRARWRAVVDPPVDRDGDGFTAHEGVTLCVGAILPEPYRAAERGTDCDDADPARYRWVTLYRDLDGDGVGARPRSTPWTCLGATLRAGFSALGFDADDADPAVAADSADDAALALVLD